jgi:cell division protein FtsL
MKSGAGAIRMGVACALLFASLSLVVWRQGRALDALRGLDAARSQRAQSQSERAQLEREIQQLESLPRVLSVATTRLGMHVPSVDQIVILALDETGARVMPDNRIAGRGMLSAAERR